MKYKDYKHSEDFKTVATVELYDKAGAVIEITSETKRQKLNNRSVLDKKRRTEDGLVIDTIVLDMDEENEVNAYETNN